MKFVSKLALSKKIALAVGGFSFPLILAVLYFVVTGNNKDVDFARKEEAGNEYQRPLITLLREIPNHQRLSAAVKRGDRSADSALAISAQEIDQGFAALASVDARYQELLQFTPEGLAKRQRQHVRVETVRDEWLRLAKDSGATSGTNADGYKHLIADIRTMIAHVGDTSNLILDPDLDSFYVMDLTLVALPQTQDRLGTIINEGSAIIAKGTLTLEDRIYFAVQAALLKESDVERVKASSQTALNEDSNCYGTSKTLQEKIPPAVAGYTLANEAFVATLLGLSSSETPTLNATAFVEAGVKARAASFALWDISIAELDSLLDNRIGAITTRRNTALGIAALAVAVAGVIAALFVKGSITRTLETVIHSLGSSSAHLSANAESISHGSQSLAQGASRNAAAVEETGAALEQMSSMTKRNAGSASTGKELSAQARNVADEGLHRLREMSQTIVGIKGAVSDLQTAVSEMQASGEEVAKIIKTIDEIAFQTNLLALNAAVEAARAGEAGMGFAVVADEVRVLAQRSAQAAKDTAEKIQTSIRRSEHGAIASQAVVGNLAGVETTASKVQQGFEAIVGKIGSLDEVIAEISAASTEQSQGIDEVTRAVSEIDKVSQASAASAEENASSAEELNAQAVTLHEVVRQLQRLVEGDSTSSLTATALPPKHQPAASHAQANVPSTPSAPVRTVTPASRQADLAIPLPPAPDIFASRSAGANDFQDF